MGCRQSIYSNEHNQVDSAASEKRPDCTQRNSKNYRSSANCFKRTTSDEKLSSKERKLVVDRLLNKRPTTNQEDGCLVSKNGELGSCSKGEEMAVVNCINDSQKKDLQGVKSSHSWSRMNEVFLLEIIRHFPFHSSAIHTQGLVASTANQQRSRHQKTSNKIKIRKSFVWHSQKRALSPVQRSSSFNALEEKKASNWRQMKKNSALNLMVLKSVETIVPMVVPLEVWLRHRLSNWVQLSGHKGTIIPASQKTLWKKRQCKEDNYEVAAYRQLMVDACMPFVPKFYKEVEYNGETFMEIEDLTSKFENPAIMDIKMGIRTFLECEVDNCKKRPDLYVKMVQLDPAEPSLVENTEKAITKLRYMQFRERESSTAELGFRIDAIKERKSSALRKDFKKLKEPDQIRRVLIEFFDAVRCTSKLGQISGRLRELRSAIERSRFFRTHEVIGSSLLFIYDDHWADVWMIDFAKAIPLRGCSNVDHRTPWSLGNREDGYLIGVDNLIKIIESCC